MHLRRHMEGALALALLLLHLLKGSGSLRSRGCVIMNFLVLGNHITIYSQHFEQLWISMLGST